VTARLRDLISLSLAHRIVTFFNRFRKYRELARFTISFSSGFVKGKVGHQFGIVPKDLEKSGSHRIHELFGIQFWISFIGSGERWVGTQMEKFVDQNLTNLRDSQILADSNTQKIEVAVAQIIW
jgi:hypothetical protein